MKRHSTKHPGCTYRLLDNGQRSYYIDFVDSAGTRIYRAVPGKLEDARRERAHILERMGKGQKIIVTKMTVAELADRYITSLCGHLKPKTKEGYSYALDHWVVPILGAKLVIDLGVGDIAFFVSKMKEPREGQPGYKAWTIRNCLTPMAGMFRYAVRQGWMWANPMNDLHRSERPKSDQAQMRILTTDEIQRLLAAATPGSPIYQRGEPTKATVDGAYHLLFTTAVFTGLRLGELLRLRWEDVDLLGGVLKVKSSKTEAGVREVVLPDFLVRMLAGAAYTDGEVFKTREGSPMKHRRVGRALEETLKRGGIPHVRFHDLRHTFASLLIANGENVVFVADQMGHANPAITLKVYAKLFDGQKSKEEARKRMDTNFAGVVG